MSPENLTETGRKAAHILLETQSVLFNVAEPFTYTSGKRGPVYVDCRRLISFTEARGSLMALGEDLIRAQVGPENIDYIAGGETAGIPYAAFLSARLEKPMVYVRKKPKGFGRMAQIEGFIEEEKRKNILLVEDVQNFGASVTVFIEALRKADTNVENLFVLFSHGHESSAQKMKELGITLHALTDWWHVLAVAKEKSRFDADTLASVEEYLNDPESWQKQFTNTG